MEAAQSGSAIPQVLAAVRVHSPATAAGGEGVDALAAAVGAALRILVAAASDSTDVRHPTLSVPSHPLASRFGGDRANAFV